MKKYICWTNLLLVLLCFGCADLIDVVPENGTTYTNYFRTVQDAEALLNNLERSVVLSRYQEEFERYEDNIDPTDYRINFDPSSFEVGWSGYYSVIYNADLMIDNAHRFELSEEEYRPYLLQAYFAKADAYFCLARNWGKVPVTKGSTNFDKLAESSVEKVLQEVEKYGLLAMDLPVWTELPWKSKQYGSKGSVAALMAYLYAWWASVGERPEMWAKAEEYCTMIIENKVGTYELAADPETVCTEVMVRDSRESIWEILLCTEDNSLSFSRAGYVTFPVRRNARPDDNYSEWVIYKNTVNELYGQGDRRRDAYFWGLEADSVFLKYVDGKAIPYAGVCRQEGDSILKGYDYRKIKKAYCYKYRNAYYTYSDDTPIPYWGGLDQNVIKYRLADIMLLRAEARVRQGKENAVEDLNTIRERAYGNREHDYTSAEGDLQMAIFREREKELMYEDHYYYDVRRNGTEYVRSELPGLYPELSDQDIKDGALYLMINSINFEGNDLLRQNVFWNRRENELK
jgi:hypothetical protein